MPPAVRNPHAQRYLFDPNYTWYDGQWRTPEGVEKARKSSCRRQRRYRATPGAYLTRRRRDLGKQRERIVNQLEELRNGIQ